jgi:DNA-binding transcriptional LysR family regulator
MSEPFMSCASIETRRFMIDPVILIAPLNHPWARRGEIEAAELLEAEYICREEGSGTDSAVRQALADIGISVHDLQTLLILGSSEAIALSVQEGLGVGFVSQIVVSKLVAGRVAQVKVRGLEIQREIHIGCQKRKPPTGTQIAFWEFIESEIAARDAVPRLTGEENFAVGAVLNEATAVLS